MELILLESAIADRDYWKKTHNTAIMKRISLLLEDILLHPFTGIGKPEPLKGNLSGFWSRRIDDTNRLVYRIQHDTLEILSCRGHYDD